VCPQLAPVVCPQLAPVVCPQAARAVCPQLAPVVCPQLAPVARAAPRRRVVWPVAPAGERSAAGPMWW